MINIHDVTDYLIDRFSSGGASDLSMLKLQKLLYYIQAWHLVNHKKRLFNNEFQAWVHGPVNKEIFDRFKETHSLYSVANRSNMKQQDLNMLKISEDQINFINDVLDVYGNCSGSELEMMSHNEEPWIKARGGISKFASSTEPIADEDMGKFYEMKLVQQNIWGKDECYWQDQ